MGLDMYLSKRPKADREEVQYWRKANAIHAWFDSRLAMGTGIENCKYYIVKREDFEALIKDIDEVLTHKDDTEIAERLLPTTAGFFYGSTEYDEWYYQDLEETKERVQQILDNNDFEEFEYEYMAWW